MNTIVGIYDLNNLLYLQNDIEQIFEKIDFLYSVDFNANVFISKIRLDDGHHWTSDESNKIFNTLIPSIKTLTKDSYAIIETIYQNELGKFDKTVIRSLEANYDNFKEYRLLNNKFKHHKSKEAEITLTKITLMEKQEQLIEVYLNYKYVDKSNGLFFSELIKLFIKILEDKGIVKISRNKSTLPLGSCLNNQS